MKTKAIAFSVLALLTESCAMPCPEGFPVRLNEFLCSRDCDPQPSSAGDTIILGNGTLTSDNLILKECDRVVQAEENVGLPWPGYSVSNESSCEETCVEMMESCSLPAYLDGPCCVCLDVVISSIDFGWVKDLQFERLRGNGVDCPQQNPNMMYGKPILCFSISDLNCQNATIIGGYVEAKAITIRITGSCL